MFCRALAVFAPVLLLAGCGGSSSADASPASTGADGSTAEEVAAAAPGAFGSGGFAFDRVKITVIKEGTGAGSTDRSIAFEQRRRLWGAISNSERQARYGKYFVVDWKAPEGNAAPVVVRFEYRQQKTGATVHSMEQTVSGAQGEVFTEFAVVGEAWATNGEVTSWRLSLLVDGRPVAGQPSFLWD